jgi:hypothetical protein
MVAKGMGLYFTILSQVVNRGSPRWIANECDAADEKYSDFDRGD